MNKVNLDQGAAKFYSEAGIGVEREATAEDRASFGSFGTGFIPREDHEKYYDKIADIVFDEKVKEAKALGVTDVDGFLRVYHGSKNPENNLDYQDKVNRYLEDPSLIDRKLSLFGMGMVIPEQLDSTKVEMFQCRNKWNCLMRVASWMKEEQQTPCQAMMFQ